jgi:hypothetical protein
MFIFSFFCFSGELTFASARLKKGKKAPGEKLPALTAGFQTTPSVEKIWPTRQDNLPQAQIADSSSTNAVSFSSACTTKRLPSSRCASAIQIVRPCQSKAETQPQLHPALLRLSATISQYFTGTAAV